MKRDSATYRITSFDYFQRRDDIVSMNARGFVKRPRLIEVQSNRISDAEINRRLHSIADDDRSTRVGGRPWSL